ncbi:MAG: A/G-specific adenine glycosylase [Nannocystaceae bacterium]|nr:A/G-specific adenine glycosylase [Nannocystaceae bacterium]
MTNAPDSALASALAADLTPWFEASHRDLTWRRTRDPYAIWVSEIMLQQTRVETVERYYSNFLERFPTVFALADAEESSVLEAWSGLGYYRRARLLHKGARHVRDEHAGAVPAEGKALRAIPGIGRYTSGAIASIAFDRPEPLVDGNVARVLSRICGVEEPKLQGAGAAGHWVLTEAILKRGRPRVLAQALMELGATVCVPRNPRCGDCPIRSHCGAYATERTGIIPAPKKRIPQPVDRLCGLVVVSRNRLLMVKRPETGLLAGMWCLPLVIDEDGPTDLGTVFSAPDGLDMWRSIGAVRHVFTHRIWELDVMTTSLGRRPKLLPGIETAWVAPGQRPAGGIPGVTTKLLAVAGFGD